MKKFLTVFNLFLISFILTAISFLFGFLNMLPLTTEFFRNFLYFSIPLMTISWFLTIWKLKDFKKFTINKEIFNKENVFWHHGAMALFSLFFSFYMLFETVSLLAHRFETLSGLYFIEVGILVVSWILTIYLEEKAKEKLKNEIFN